MTIYDDLKAGIDKIIADYKAANADGKLSFSEIFTLVGNAIATFVQLIENFGSGTGAEKKAAVLAAIDQLFDEVIIPIDIKGIPNMLEGIVDKALKQLVLTLADGWSIRSLTFSTRPVGDRQVANLPETQKTHKVPALAFQARPQDLKPTKVRFKIRILGDSHGDATW